MKRSTILLSGGQDSTALAYWLRPESAIFVDYGQIPAQSEKRAAQQVCKTLGIKFSPLAIDCSSIGAGQLAGDNKKIRGATTPEWWPFRNQLLITFGAAHAIKNGSTELLIGTVLEDSKHSDGRKVFLQTIDKLLSVQEGKLRLSAPAKHLSSSALIRRSKIPESILGWTHSCFVSNIPCLQCRGCAKHLRVLESLKMRYSRQ